MSSNKRSGLPVGLNRGHKTTPRELKPRPSSRKGRSSASRQLVSGVIRDVAGYAPCKSADGARNRAQAIIQDTQLTPGTDERRAMELLRNSKDKKARKLVKRRLGTLRRAKRKVEELTGVIAEARRAGH